MSQSEMELSMDDIELETPKIVRNQNTKENVDKILDKSVQKNEDGSTGRMKLDNKIVNSLDQQANQVIDQLLATNAGSEEFKDLSALLGKIGDDEVTRSSAVSDSMLNRRSVRSMKENKFGEGDTIGKNLTMLRQTVTGLDPSRRNGVFGGGWKSLVPKFMPFGIGKKVDAYFSEYQTAQGQINDIVSALYRGKDELMKDNAYIDESREQMRIMMQRLEQYIYLMKKIDERIEERLPGIESEDKMKADDIKTEIQFPLRQKRMDLAQHMAVSMQGFLALQVLKSNNLELMRGVDRATKTTMAALRTAVLVSEALGTQKLVLEQIKAVNEVTNNMIESTSKQLAQQGAEIQKQATESAINVKTLEVAFKNIFSAMDAMDKYRVDALPGMKTTIESLENTINEAKTHISSNRANRIGNFMEEIKSQEEHKLDDTVVLRKNKM